MNTTDAHHKNKSKVTQETSFVICSCGYPRIPNTVICPFCGIDDEELLEVAEGNEIIEEIENLNNLVLKPFGEFIELYPEIEIQVNEKILTKQDIDKTDSYLSSKGHAKFLKKDDKWFIENIASNKAVFLQVEKSAPLKNGDVILLGKNRLYQIYIK